MPGRWRARVEAPIPGRWRGREASMPGSGWRTRSAKPPPYDRMIRMIRMTRRAGAAPMPGRWCGREASMPGWLQVYNNKAACSCPSSLSKFGNPNLDKNLDKELGQILTCFSLAGHLSKFARGTWTRNLDNCGLPCYKLTQYYSIPGRPRNLAQGGNPNLDKNLDKELGQVLSRVFFLQSHLRGTWTRNLDNRRLPC